MKKKPTQHRRYAYGVMAVFDIGITALFGMILLAQPTTQVMAATTPIVASQKPVVIEQRKAVIGTPNRIVVPDIAIDNNVRPGAYNPDDASWTIDNQSAFHADVSVPANDNNGVTFIYGHADWTVFGRLPDASEGMEAVVYTNEGITFEYRYESSRQVDPSDVSILTSDGPPKLVLQTCSGPFDAYRTLVTFYLEKVSKI